MKYMYVVFFSVGNREFHDDANICFPTEKMAIEYAARDILKDNPGRIDLYKQCKRELKIYGSFQNYCVYPVPVGTKDDIFKKLHE